MTPEEELAKIREEHTPFGLTELGGRYCSGCSPASGNVAVWVDFPCAAIRALFLAAQLARDHAQSGCGGGCGDLIAAKIEGGER